MYLPCILYFRCVQVLVSALGAADDSGLLRFGMVLYTREGEYCTVYYVLCTVLYYALHQGGRVPARPAREGLGAW